MRVGHIGSTFHSGSLQRLYWSLRSDVCSPECDEWLCRHFPLVSHCPQTSLRRARHPDVGPNELFVLRLQSGNGLFPTDDKGNLLAGKSTFLDAWEVDFELWTSCLHPQRGCDYQLTPRPICCRNSSLRCQTQLAVLWGRPWRYVDPGRSTCLGAELGLKSSLLTTCPAQNEINTRSWGLFFYYPQWSHSELSQR